MRGFVVIIIISVLGFTGWMVGEPLGIFAAFALSMIGSGVGLYVGRKVVNEYMP